MRKTQKYDISNLVEAQFEPGSHGHVLKNLVGVKRKREMDLLEAREHYKALVGLAGKYGINHRFTARDICAMHETWLGAVYPWAGKYRNINISKGGFSFAAAQYIPKLMAELEKGPLREYTPCRFSLHNEIARALAVVHVELVLIHPFREGNGRVARIVTVLMALQAGLPPLDFSAIKGKKRQEYFAGVRAGLSRNYEVMEATMRSVIADTLRTCQKT